MMTKQDYFKLLDKYEAGLATQEEERLLYAYYNLFDLRKDGLQDLSELQMARLGSGIRESIDQRILLKPAKDRQVKLWPKIAVAAAAVAAVVAGVWFFSAPRHPDAGQDPGSAQYSTDVAPGKNGATITLADGQVIELSDAKSGVVIAAELKYSDGSDVRYSSGSRSTGPASTGQRTTGPVGVRSLTPSELQGVNGSVQNLTASTARSQTYQFTLPDGTKVWLNAESKISFPVKFSGGERRILLSGEGYFEVTKDKAHPFIVATDKQEVEVLGTHFNINSYADEASIKTTLLEGSVRINTLPRNGVSGAGIVIRPGEQAVLVNSAIKVKAVDAEEAVSWKSGKFSFEREEMGSIMRKVARWYNVEVIFADPLQQVKLTGSISRFEQVSKLLEMLENTKEVHFKVEGRKVYVSK